jgi:hypothetical protein
VAGEERAETLTEALVQPCNGITHGISVNPSTKYVNPSTSAARSPQFVGDEFSLLTSAFDAWTVVPMAAGETLV